MIEPHYVHVEIRWEAASQEEARTRTQEVLDMTCLHGVWSFCPDPMDEYVRGAEEHR